MRNPLISIVLIVASVGVQAKSFGDYAVRELNNGVKVAETAIPKSLPLQIIASDSGVSAFVAKQPAKIIADGVDLGTTLDRNEMILFKNANRMQVIAWGSTLEISTKGSGATAIWLTDDKLETNSIDIVATPQKVYDLGFTTTNSKEDACRILLNGWHRLIYEQRQYSERVDIMIEHDIRPSEEEIQINLRNAREGAKKFQQASEFGCDLKQFKLK
ncbi:hypothetical protein [Vibrio atlanticus]|uniref:hypothetical protein n=1 Tax=Vibrio atlanticus TaxID=693153 RepID=UPI000EFCDD0D|nr:hypothetical protein [Vibrio atlanticus]